MSCVTKRSNKIRTLKCCLCFRMWKSIVASRGDLEEQEGQMLEWSGLKSEREMEAEKRWERQLQ